MKGRIAVSYLQGLAGLGREGYMEIILVFKYGEVGVFLLDKIGTVVVTRAGIRRAVGGSVADLKMPSTVAPATNRNQAPHRGDNWDSGSPGWGQAETPAMESLPLKCRTLSVMVMSGFCGVRTCISWQLTHPRGSVQPPEGSRQPRACTALPRPPRHPGGSAGQSPLEYRRCSSPAGESPQGCSAGDFPSGFPG